MGPPVKEQPAVEIVGVVTSLTELAVASRLKNPPDLFEIRLDRLYHHLDDVEPKLPALRAPLIITARHPREGGANDLSLRQRGDLLRRFLPCARYLDVELRSAKFLRPLLRRARHQGVGCIISFHDFRATPSLLALKMKLRAAKSYRPAIFKVATRTRTSEQLRRLLTFFSAADAQEGARDRLRVCAMGLGQRGIESRRELVQRGSALTYAHLGAATVDGQPSLSQIQRWAAALPTKARRDRRSASKS